MVKPARVAPQPQGNAQNTQVQTTAPSPFAVQWGGPPPARTGPGAGAGKPAGEETRAIQALPAPSDGKFPFIFVPVKVPDTITDPDEKKRAAKEAAHKLSSKLSGITRRIIKQAEKQGDLSLNYTTRSGEANGVFGVYVWRITPEAPAPQPAQG